MTTISSDRQGDVLMLAAELPADATDITPKGKRVVLKYGEATDHAHAFYGQPVRLYETPNKERFLRVVETSYLKHEEHSTVEVPQGTERITIPLEGADPTWYKVAQATGTDSTTLRPNATVTTSKLATASKSLTVAKLGARGGA